LGLLHGGQCCVPSQPNSIPADFHLCNFGYARGVCEKFPADAPFDAVRFAIVGQDAQVTQLLYVFERDHAPAEHGRITCNKRQLEENEVLMAQAHAFIAANTGR
jgi:hypothetical protein